ncbi:putative ATP-dependent RNA helicase DDX60 [Camelus dromedarius]|uniref:Putative ATP-dependent RNA helicase DDX60 n=1 Tax=Camelus dromedarius TaxID=9838 RepID=A0A5N4CAG1_CAMDR|nr:putative ATP-dependent RNA helicase DDX60 [Camelus dromedarius]
MKDKNVHIEGVRWVPNTFKDKMPNLGFIPVSCQVVDKFVGDILKDLPFLVSDDPAVALLVRQKEFDELVHWHPADPSVTTTTGQSVSSMALVNQVAATVQNRFNKNLPSGEALCGVFTRDYRHDALNSQVLVTVPACFEILLLAPHRQAWVKRIRYVIFDEPLYVHLLESLLSFPVLYRERYNDLEKHVCSVRDGVIHFDHFHLCAVLTTDHESEAPAKLVLKGVNYLCPVEKLPG